MTTGKKSRTSDHPTGIGGSQTISRAMAGSGNRGQHASLRVAVVGSTTIRNVPFVHSASDLYLSQLQRILQVSNPCALLVVKSSGRTFPKVSLSRSCWLLQTRSDGSGGTLSQAFLQSAQGKSKTKATTPECELAQKESEYNKASANERLLEKKLQRSTETVEELRKQLQAEQDILGRLVPALSQAKEAAKQSMDGSRAMRIAVHGAGADGDKNASRPAPMEQDTDMFKQKIQLLNESAKRARTESNVDHSALLECVDGLLGEANALFLKNANTSDIINIDPCL